LYTPSVRPPTSTDMLVPSQEPLSFSVFN
jgi:hypothetical protein